MTNVGSYSRGLNTFMVAASPSCFGYSNTLAELDGHYAKITVFPQHLHLPLHAISET